jgi:type IV secretion system protein VirB6
MGFFAEFDAWLTQLLQSYVSDTLASVAGALEPAVIALGAVYVAAWGYLQMTGEIEEPAMSGLKRIGTLALVIGVGLRLWMYHEVAVDTFMNAPGELAAAIVGAPDSVAVVDRILLTGGDAAQALLAKGGLLDGSLTFTLAGFFVYAVVGVTGLYAMFLLALSRVALSVLLGLGPLFIATLLFKSTRRWFESWVSQLTNYASIAILTGLVSALLLRLVTAAAASAAAAGPAVQIADAVRVCLASGLILLVLRQVMPMAAGLSHGFALHSFGAVSRTLGWGLEHGADMLSRGRGAVMGRR